MEPKMAAVKIETQMTVPPAACAAALALFMRVEMRDKYPAVEICSMFKSSDRSHKTIMVFHIASLSTDLFSYSNRQRTACSFISLHSLAVVSFPVVLPRPTPVTMPWPMPPANAIGRPMCPASTTAALKVTRARPSL